MAGARGRPVAAEAPVSGVAFPLVDGRRSSTVTTTGVLADAVEALHPSLARRITDEREWRSAYARHVRDVVVASAATPHAACAVADAGLESLQRRLVVATDDGDIALPTAVRAAPRQPLRSVVVAGEGTREAELSVPYAGQRLRGAGLDRQLDSWVDCGAVEPSHAEAVRAVAANPDWLDLSDVSVALVGAAAEMAPLPSLLRWGATVHAVDIPVPAVWQRIGQLARGGAGRVVAPVRTVGVGLDAAGIDVLAEPQAVLHWLRELDKQLVVGNYVYADGAAFTRVSGALDAVIAALLADRPDTVTAMLATPTDVFATPPEAVAEARSRWAARRVRRVTQLPAQAISGGRLFRPNYATTLTVPDGRELGIADSLVVQQGPNYALAKQVHRWRAISEHTAGRLVSANVAPPTRTRSVLKNRALAAAYAGAHRFGVEVFAPATSSTLMAALLVHDLRAGRPELTHPHDLFMRGANHGGLWRVAYEPRSVLGLAVLLGLAGARG